MNFSTRLKELRLKAGYTNQTDLAKELNTSQQNYSQWESGKRNPSQKTLKKLADFFNVSVDYLKGNNELDLEKVKDSLRYSLGFNGNLNIPEEEIQSMAEAFLEHFSNRK